MKDEDFTKNQRYRKARKQVREIRYFYLHLLVYILVSPCLVYINVTFSAEFYWFPFSIFGWSFGLLFHGLEAFRYTPFLGSGWEQKKIAQFMEEERKREQALREYRHKNQIE